MWKNTITFSPTNTEKDLKEVFLWLSIHLRTETPLEKLILRRAEFNSMGQWD